MYWQRLQALWAALSAHLQGLPIPGNWGFCARRPLHSSGGVTVYSDTDIHKRGRYAEEDTTGEATNPY